MNNEKLKELKSMADEYHDLEKQNKNKERTLFMTITPLLSLKNIEKLLID